MSIAILLFCTFSAISVSDDEAAAVNAVLDRALDKCWEQEDPRESVRCVLRTMFSVDPKYAVEQTRTAARRLAGMMQLEATAVSTFGPLAEVVAPYDRELREELLALAIDESEDALSDESVWRTKGQRFAAIGNGMSIVFERKRRHLQFSNRLYRAVLAHSEDAIAAEAAMKSLFVDARAAGGYVLNHELRYEDVLVGQFSKLDWRWMMKFVGEEWGVEKFAKYCDHEGCSVWNDYDRNEFTRERILWAIGHGARRRETFQVLVHIDIALAWKLASSLEPGERDRDEIQVSVHRELAWHDLDTALDVAEAEPDALRRQQMLASVAHAWAHCRPESIEHALRLQDYLWARESAAAEMLRRSRGEPSGPTLARIRGHHVPGRLEFRRREPRSGNPEEVRILENPRDTSWLDRRNRRKFLNQAGMVSYLETGELDGIAEIVAGLSDQKERDEVRRYNAQHLAEVGRLEDAALLCHQVESPQVYVDAACGIARAIVRESRYREWPP